MIAIIASLCTVGLLGSYAFSRGLMKPRIFDWGNVVVFIPFMYINGLVGAWWAVIVNLVFGVIGIVSLRRG